MKGKFILRVKDTDVKMEFDFDNYRYDDSYTINQESLSKIMSIEGEDIHWLIHENKVFKTFHEFLGIDFKFEKDPCNDTERIQRKHDELLEKVNEYLDSGGDDFIVIERK